MDLTDAVRNNHLGLFIVRDPVNSNPGRLVALTAEMAVRGTKYIAELGNVLALFSAPWHITEVPEECLLAEFSRTRGKAFERRILYFPEDWVLPYNFSLSEWHVANAPIYAVPKHP